MHVPRKDFFFNSGEEVRVRGKLGQKRTNKVQEDIVEMIKLEASKKSG